MECKTSRKQQFYSVKIYLNWEISTDEFPAPAHVRLAGDKSLSKSLSTKTTQCLEVIDIPCKHAISCIETCSKSCNLIVASNETTDIYHLIEKTVVNSDKTYQDVVLFLKLEWSFSVRNVSLCEDFLAVLSDKEVQVVKITYSDKTKKDADKSNVARSIRSVSVDSFRMANRKTSSSIMNPNVSLDKDNIAENTEYFTSELRNSSTPSPALSNSSKSYNDPYNCIQDDEFFVSWKFDGHTTTTGDSATSPEGFKRKTKNVLIQDNSRTVTLPALQEMINRDLLLAVSPKASDLRGKELE